MDNYRMMFDDPLFWKVLGNNLWFALGTILPMIAVANIWLFFYTPDIGLIKQILSAVGLSGRNWLGDPATLLLAVMVMTICSFLPRGDRTTPAICCCTIFLKPHFPILKPIMPQPCPGPLLCGTPSILWSW